MPRPDPRVINSLFFRPLSFRSRCCHGNSFFSFKSYCIRLVSINLTRSRRSPFRFSNPPHPCIHLVALPPTPPIPSPATPPLPPPPPQAQPPLWYSQSHLQSDIFNGLITLSSHGVIEHPTPAPHPARPLAPTPLPLPHLHPLTAPLKCFLLISPPSLGLLLPPFSHLASAKALPWTRDPHPDLPLAGATAPVVPFLLSATELR